MLSSKQVNKEVVKMYKDQPYIQTVITLNTPLDKESDLYKGFQTFLATIEPTMKGLNAEVEDKIAENFESDIVSIYSGVKNLKGK